MTVAALDVGDVLARIAAALDVPVLVLAIVLFLVLAVEAGRFAAEAWRRRGGRAARALRELVRTARAHPSAAAQLSTQAPNRIAAAAVRALATASPAATLPAAAVPPAAAAAPTVATEHALADYELAVQRRLDRTRLLVRAGPALGLMGTLIPLAPGLEALGGGDIRQLADDLRTAFGATVVGLLVGTAAFALTLARTRFYTEDLTALERGAADRLPDDTPAPSSSAAPPVAAAAPGTGALADDARGAR